MATERVYTWGEVADRIEAELGIRVAQHVLMTWRRRHDDRRRLLTEGMPEPFHVPGHGTRVFRADEVDDWLSTHPKNPTRRALDRLVQLLRTTQDRRELVAFVHAGGASWEQISEALSAADGIEHHPDLVHRAYCPRRR
jgi:hypothetical protein